MPYFPQDLFQAAAARGGLDDPDYLEARQTCLRLTRTDGIDKALSDHRLDAIVAPTTCAPWLIDWVNGDNRSGSSAYLAAISGYPSITVPAGYLFGLPVGVSFIASAWQEPALIRLAYAFEQATQVRRPPTYRASTESCSTIRTCRNTCPTAATARTPGIRVLSCTDPAVVPQRIRSCRNQSRTSRAT